MFRILDFPVFVLQAGSVLAFCLTLPLLLTLALLLSFETGRPPFMRSGGVPAFRFQTRRTNGMIGRWGARVEVTGLVHLPALLDVIAGSPPPFRMGRVRATNLRVLKSSQK